jgi:hypothetical protein
MGWEIGVWDFLVHFYLVQFSSKSGAAGRVLVRENKAA